MADRRECKVHVEDALKASCSNAKSGFKKAIFNVVDQTSAEVSESGRVPIVTESQMCNPV